MAIAIGVLVVLAGIAVLALTRLDAGRDATDRRRARRPSSTTTTTRAPTTTTSAPRKTVHYTVQQGDTLSAIARRFHVSTGALALANKLQSPDRLTVGQRLTIPPEVPVRLVIRPAAVAPGGTVDLALSGAQPGERVTFEIQKPSGSFKGPVHVAEADGTVATTYSVNASDPPASYLVVARGDQGTTAAGAITVVTTTAR